MFQRESAPGGWALEFVDTFLGIARIPASSSPDEARHDWESTYIKPSGVLYSFLFMCCI